MEARVTEGRMRAPERRERPRCRPEHMPHPDEVLEACGALTFYGGEKAVKRGRLLLLAFRTLVDEPNDVIIQWYAKQIGVDPKELSDEVKEQIDNILKNIPAREMIIDIEPKEAKPLANRG